MIEVCALDSLAVRIEGDISPYRTPKTCSVNRNDSRLVVEDEYRKSGLAVLHALDYIIELLELAWGIYLASLDIGHFLALGVDREGGSDLLVVFGNHCIVALGLEIGFGTELGGGHHLADGVSLLVCLLLALEGL